MNHSPKVPINDIVMPRADNPTLIIFILRVAILILVVDYSNIVFDMLNLNSPRPSDTPLETSLP